jgi:endonuclease/exonuclease/phosphatase family metal-dependent hydrolase
MKIAKRVIATLLCLILLAFAAIVWMANGFQSPKSFDERPVHLEDVAPRARTSSSADTITVLTYNIAWGYGWGSEGTGKAKPKEHFLRSMERLADVIRKVDADIVLMQEVDFGATRSHHIEEASAIARAAGMPYVATALSWNANWVPFPYWPPEDQFGQMRSGGAIISRWPITAHHVDLLPKPAQNAWWYNLFYLFRFLERVTIEVDGTKLQVFNTHIEAFNEPNRVEHAELIRRTIQQQITAKTIFGGDFNTVPPESLRKSDYPDETAVKTEHSHDKTLDVVRTIHGLKDVIPAEEFRAHQDRYFTFPSHAPNRKIDYIFVGDDFDVLEARVVTEAGDVSDHLPIVAKLRLRSSK